MRLAENAKNCLEVLYQLIDKGFVKINEKFITKNGRKLKTDEKVEVAIPEEENVDKGIIIN